GAEEHDAEHAADDAPGARLALALAGGRDVDRPANAHCSLFLVGGGHTRDCHAHPGAHLHLHGQHVGLGRNERTVEVHVVVAGGTAAIAPAGAAGGRLFIAPFIPALSLSPAGAGVAPPGPPTGAGAAHGGPLT